MSTEFSIFGTTYPSEREAVVGFMDRIQVAEACAGRAIADWVGKCRIAELRGGLKMIAEREAYHGRTFQQRIRELGHECKAELDRFSLENEACIANLGLSDLEKLTTLVENAGEPEKFLRPILDFANALKDDAESAEILRLFHADEVSSATWLNDMCRKLTAEAALSHAAE